MGDIFLKLLNMSITAGWLILAVIGIRLLFRKMPKWIRCALWGLVAVRLIVPFSIESTFSLLPSSETIRSSTIVEGEVVHHLPSVDSSLPMVEDTVNPVLLDTFSYEQADSVAPLQVVTEIAGYLWLGGMILLVLYALVSTIRLFFMVREAVCYKDNIYLCDAVKTPFILGFVRPEIYLPSVLSEEETEHIIAHEKAHLKRLDHLWKFLGYLLLCVYWFQPLCIIAYVMLCKDIELACDEKVIKNMSFSDRKRYSHVLLSCAARNHFVLASPLAFGEVGVKDRIKSILDYKKAAVGMTILAILIGLLVSVCFLTNPPREYQIRITIPAGSEWAYCYSDEEISPKGNTLTIANGEGLGDTEVILLPVEVKEENAYDEGAYMTPGVPVKFEVEKGAWFKIGVRVQNTSAEDRNVYVTVRNVDVRIASEDVGSKSVSDVDVALVNELIWVTDGKIEWTEEKEEKLLSFLDSEGWIVADRVTFLSYDGDSMVEELKKWNDLAEKQEVNRSIAFISVHDKELAQKLREEDLCFDIYNMSSSKMYPPGNLKDFVPCEQAREILGDYVTYSTMKQTTDTQRIDTPLVVYQYEEIAKILVQ